MTKVEKAAAVPVRHSGFVIDSSFFAWKAFTLIELLVVIAIIVVLAGLVLSTVGYVQKKGARARAETEIAAMSASLESYKADTGVYPRNNDTDNLNPSVSDTSAYTNATAYLTWSLSPAETIPDPPPPPGPDPYQTIRNQVQSWLSSGAIKEYFNVKNANLSKPPSSAATTISVVNPSNPNTQVSIPARVYTDPFGNSYGYSTMMAAAGSGGHNPTFDLWSTANSSDQNQWIKNW